MYRQTNCLIVHHFLRAKRLASQILYEQHYVLISLNGKEINKYQYQILPGTQQSPSTESLCKMLISSPSKVHIMCKQEQNTHVCTPLGCTAHYLPCIVQSRRHTGME